MQLRDWIHKEKMKKVDFAKHVNYCAHYITMACGYKKKPSIKFAMIVQNFTKGEVTVEELMNAEYGKKNPESQ